MALVKLIAVLLFAACAVAQTVTPAPTSTSTVKPTITAVSDCHPHSTVKYVHFRDERTALISDSWCMVGTEEYQVVGPTRTQDMQAQYTDCHTHGTET
jgi:zinc transporter 1/2/3